MLTLLLSPALSLCTLFPYTLAPVPPFPAASAGEKKDELGPPGLVALKGGTTFIGSSKKDIDKLLKEMPGIAWRKLRSLDATTPQNRVTVAPFHMGLTEVTNEQYAVFVMATGHRPPEDWGDEPIATAQALFLSEQGELRAEAKEKGLPIPERREFRRDEWWLANWKQSTWAIPEQADLKPVTYVNYADVQAYCRWAGVRLPTEFEYQRACRGTSKNPFPWGDEWEDAKYCATSEIKRVNATFLVGSFEAGVSPDGLFDLAGNVWEWTSSPYGPYAKFKRNKYKLDRKTESLPQPTWDGNQRVAVGGSWQNPGLAARCTTRRPTDRTQMTDAFGFRLAASLAVGVDKAQAIFNTQ
ncbi:MAG: SUMF1/EgtB/PvdO family nonheme iron enzyme, partial [Planctomycetota bacterium]